MIAIFTDQSDTEFVGWVKTAARSAGVSDLDITVVALDRDGLRTREYAKTIREMQACVVDMDKMDILGYAAELGSLGEGLFYMVGVREDQYGSSSLDARLMLVTRQSLKDHRVIRYFGDYCSSISLENGITPELTKGLADWIHDTVASTVPRVFVSYRSAQYAYAQQLADSLVRKGASIWFDQLHIAPGDSIPTEVNRGLGWCTHLIMIVDATFFDSKWTHAEVEVVLHRHLSGRYLFRMQDNPRPLIPLFLVDPASASMPPMLQRLHGIDCRGKSVDEVVDQLWNAISLVGPR